MFKQSNHLFLPKTLVDAQLLKGIVQLFNRLCFFELGLLRTLKQIEGEVIELNEGVESGKEVHEVRLARWGCARRRVWPENGEVLRPVCGVQAPVGARVARPQEPYPPLEQREGFPFPFPWGSRGRERERSGSSKGRRS